jgi:hypothetical protein
MGVGAVDVRLLLGELRMTHVLTVTGPRARSRPYLEP